MTYCSKQCQTSHWKASHRLACKQLKYHRDVERARAKEDGRPAKNRQFIIDWYMERLGLIAEVEFLAWRHRNEEEMHVVCVRTFANSSSSGLPSGTPQLTAMPASQWAQDLYERGMSEAHTALFPDCEYAVTEAFTMSIELNHAGTETWPRYATMSMNFRDPMKMDEALLAQLLQVCILANTFQEKLAAESAVEAHKHAHPEIITQLDVNSPLRVALRHRVHHDTRGCLRGLCSASHLNDTLGLFVSADPKNPSRSIVQLADGQVRSVPKASFEPLRLDTGGVVLHGLTGAAHLNGKLGTLLELNRKSVDRVTVRLVDGRHQEVAVKFANYKCIV